MLSDVALWRVTARGSAFAPSCSPADLVTNLKALATVAETRPRAICPTGAAAVARAAYARAVEWSDVELKSAAHALDRLAAFVPAEENTTTTFAETDDSNDDPNDPNDPNRSNDPNDSKASSRVEKDSGGFGSPPKKKRRRKKAGPSGKTPQRKDASVVTRHAFAEGFDATRALVRAVAAARADGTLMSVARGRGGAKQAGSETETRFARKKKPQPKKQKKPKRGDDAEARSVSGGRTDDDSFDAS